MDRTTITILKIVVLILAIVLMCLFVHEKKCKGKGRHSRIAKILGKPRIHP